MANYVKDEMRDDEAYKDTLTEAPANPREETERIETIVTLVIEKHADTLRKLADE